MVYQRDEFVENFEGFFHQNLKPLLEDEQYSKVHKCLDDSINFLKMDYNALRVMVTTHCSISFLTYLIYLHDETKNGGIPDPETVMGLEAYLAQTNLPGEDFIDK